MPAGQRAEVAPGLGQRDLHHRGAVTADGGVGLHALADPQRTLSQFVQAATGLTVLDGHLERLPELPQDLLIAHDHRVEATGDPEGMPDRGILVVDVQVGGQLVRRQPGTLGQNRGDRFHSGVESGDLGVHLDAVAGRQQQGFAHSVTGADHRQGLSDVDGGHLLQDVQGALWWLTPSTNRLIDLLHAPRAQPGSGSRWPGRPGAPPPSPVWTGGPRRG